MTTRSFPFWPLQANGPFDLGIGPFVMTEPKATQSIFLWAGPPRETSMSERDWNEEKRSVLSRLFDAAFGR